MRRDERPNPDDEPPVRGAEDHDTVGTVGVHSDTEVAGVIEGGDGRGDFVEEVHPADTTTVC